jgi:hypothetical protein
LWDGPSIGLQVNNSTPTDFNSDRYELDIWEYNPSNNYSGPSQYQKSDDAPLSSFTTGDIYYQLHNTENSCHRYHFQLVLLNCSGSRLFTGDFIVNNCHYDANSNSCIEYCCFRDFSFNNKTICLGETYKPDDFQWNAYDPISIFDETIDYGDGTAIYTNTDVSDIVIPPDHYYSMPGIYSVTITLDFKKSSGCIINGINNGQVIRQQYVTVNGGEPNPELFIPDYTICYTPTGVCNNTINRCIPFWEGPKIDPLAHLPWNNAANAYNNFNANSYELTINHYNSNHQITGGSTYTGSKPIEESYNEGDITRQFNPDITCVKYKYTLTLRSCTYGQTPYVNSEYTYYGVIKVRPCTCNASYCNPVDCPNNYFEENWGESISPDSINGINDINNETYNIKIYPNPTKDKLFINVSSDNNNPLEYKIELQNILSETLLTIKTKNTDFYILDLSYYCKGMYLVKIITNNKVFIYKVIKE